MSLIALYLRGTKISCLLKAIKEGGFYLPAYLYIYYLCGTLFQTEPEFKLEKEEQESDPKPPLPPDCT